MIVGVDLDGVLARFEDGYAPILTRYAAALGHKVEFPKLGQIAEWPDEWDWDKTALLQAGLTDKEMKAVRNAAWNEINARADFWMTLPAHEGAMEFLEFLTALPCDTYFITQRSSATAKLQTEFWLMANGLEYFPTVLVQRTRESSKGIMCHALGITHYIDDKDENCVDVQTTSPKTLGVMLARPWNHEQEGIPRLGTLSEFQMILHDTYQKEAA